MNVFQPQQRLFVTLPGWINRTTIRITGQTKAGIPFDSIGPRKQINQRRQCVPPRSMNPWPRDSTIWSPTYRQSACSSRRIFRIRPFFFWGGASCCQRNGGDAQNTGYPALSYLPCSIVQETFLLIGGFWRRSCSEKTEHAACSRCLGGGLSCLSAWVFLSVLTAWRKAR